MQHSLTDTSARLAWRSRPLPAAALAQVGGALIALLGQWVGARALGHDPLASPLALACMQAFAAATIARLAGARWWWCVIHLAFMPAVVLARGFALAPGWYLGAFAMLLLVFWRTDRSQVPLYLSNRTTVDAVAALLPAAPLHMIDLGCGHAGLLARLARRRPDCHFTGVEHAPLPWAIGRLCALGRPNLEIRYGDFWKTDLAEFDIVYAFLSPVPMTELWRKAMSELRSGALVIVNTFEIPEERPESSMTLDDRRETRLFCYRVARRAETKTAPQPVARRRR